MNVLILTPDRVGSTLLQRVLTVYLLGQNIDKPVINLHELTNGLIKYYNPVTNSEVLGKPESTGWGYYQNLNTIVDLLKSVDHYKTSRLAHYHILRRKDSIDDQLKFYEFLNNNFYIISCRRENVFEYALSWVINSHSKKLNVYSIEEKIETFGDIYKNKIVAPKELLVKYLSNYKNYIDWSDTYFNIQSFFNYDTDIHNLENYVLNLDLMKKYSKRTWQDMFGQDFKDYNACHRMLPNLFLLENNKVTTKELPFFTTNPVKKNWDQLKGADWPASALDYLTDNSNLPAEIRSEIDQVFNKQNFKITETEYKFLTKNLHKYFETNVELAKLVTDGFMVTGLPIKLQSLAEKRLIIENFDQCVDWYNEWVQENNFGKPYSLDSLLQISVEEENKLNLQINLLEDSTSQTLQIK